MKRIVIAIVVATLVCTREVFAQSKMHRKKDQKSLRGNTKTNFKTFENIQYHPTSQIMAQGVSVYNIYYGDFSSPASQVTVSLLDYFVANIGSTSWYKTVSQYYHYSTDQNNKYSTVYASSDISFKFSSNIAQSASGSIQEGDILNGIKLFLQTNSLQPDTNAIYAVMFNGRLKYTAPDKSSWLSEWCGYHGNFMYGDTRLKFMVLGDPSTAQYPDNGCSFSGSSPPNGSPGADAMVDMFGHELLESVTDPYLNAWFFNSNGDENMDRCAWTYDPYLPDMGNSANIIVGNRKFLLQQVFVPNQGCMMPPAAAPSSPIIASTSSPLSTLRPSKSPIRSPTKNPVVSPTLVLTEAPANSPSNSPRKTPTRTPKAFPSPTPSALPSHVPSTSSTWSPSTSMKKSKKPALSPTTGPSSTPTRLLPESTPTSNGDVKIAPKPSIASTVSPSKTLTRRPSKQPVSKPTRGPSPAPSQLLPQNSLRSTSDDATVVQAQTTLSGLNS